jgi:hypothetical protein
MFVTAESAAVLVDSEEAVAGPATGVAEAEMDSDRAVVLDRDRGSDWGVLRQALA